MNKIKRFLSLGLVVAMVCSVFVGCSSDSKYENYSYGIEDTGYYKNFDQYTFDAVPVLEDLKISHDEVLDWAVATSIENGSETVTDVDSYVREYATAQLYLMGLGVKEVCEAGDHVTASLSFYIDDKKLEGFDSTDSYTAETEGDAIKTSFIGHAPNDTYDVEYTFPEDDADYPGKKAIVKITISSIVSKDPIAEGYVEKNIDTIAKYVDGVTDAESYLAAMRPKAAESTLGNYMKDYLTKIEGVEPPEDYVEYEYYRLRSRLNQLGYTYKGYLEEAGLTEEDIMEYCKNVARENCIYLTICKRYETSVTIDDIKEYYGENYESIKEVQGHPYMKLKMFRDAALYQAMTRVKLVESK